jgi:hypothetical protein
MLCGLCSALPADTRQLDVGAADVGAVTGVACARCGAVLGRDDLVTRLVRKLEQLSQFGLAGRDVLRPPTEDAKDP